MKTRTIEDKKGAKRSIMEINADYMEMLDGKPQPQAQQQPYAQPYVQQQPYMQQPYAQPQYPQQQYVGADEPPF